MLKFEKRQILHEFWFQEEKKFAKRIESKKIVYHYENDYYLFIIVPVNWTQQDTLDFSDCGFHQEQDWNIILMIFQDFSSF